MKNMEGPSNDGKESRRGFLKKLGILGAGLVLAPEKVFSNSNTENNESNRIIKSSEMIEMEDGGNLPDGFKRTKINLEFNDERGKIEGAGSMFMFDNDKGKAEFISKKSNPYFFTGGVDFDKLKHDYDSMDEQVALIVAGAYYKPGTNDIEGIALEDGVMVGEDIPKAGSNGLLVIENGEPHIEFINQIPDLDSYLNKLKSEKADAFQQTSYIRPGGTFSSGKDVKWELRFFVEGEYNGQIKKGVLNFSIDMTYTEAVEAMKKITGFKIQKAIGLDTGDMSEGYFYEKNGKKNLMIDEDSGTHRDEYTNVLVLYSKK